MGKFKEIEIVKSDLKTEGQLSQLNFLGLIELIRNFSASTKSDESFDRNAFVETTSENQLILQASS